MGEKNNFTLFIGDSAVSALSEMPEITPDMEFNTEEDLTRVLRTGGESATFECKMVRKVFTKIYIGKTPPYDTTALWIDTNGMTEKEVDKVKRVLRKQNFQEISKNMFSKEAL